MSHQDGLGDNGPETTGFTEPDDGDDRVQKESDNVAHARMVSNGRSSRNSGCLRNSPTTRQPGGIQKFVNRKIRTPIAGAACAGFCVLPWTHRGFLLGSEDDTFFWIHGPFLIDIYKVQSNKNPNTT